MEHYQNDSVIDRIAKEEGVDRATAERWFEGTLQFLEVASTAGRPVSPSLPIDAGWHAFILHTKDYAAYCDERFGRFIHHQPTGEGVSNRDNYLAARAMASERFDLDPEVWPERKTVEECGSCCGRACGSEHPVLVAAGCAPDSDCHDDGSCDAM